MSVVGVSLNKQRPVQAAPRHFAMQPTARSGSAKAVYEGSGDFLVSDPKFPGLARIALHEHGTNRYKRLAQMPKTFPSGSIPSYPPHGRCTTGTPRDCRRRHSAPTSSTSKVNFTGFSSRG